MINESYSKDGRGLGSHSLSRAWAAASSFATLAFEFELFPYTFPETAHAIVSVEFLID